MKLPPHFALSKRAHKATPKDDGKRHATTNWVNGYRGSIVVYPSGSLQYSLLCKESGEIKVGVTPRALNTALGYTE